MKKIIFAFVAFAALSMSSCGNKTVFSNDSDSITIDSVVDSVSVDSVHTDSVAVDSMCAE